MRRVYRPTPDDAALVGGAVGSLGEGVAVLRSEQGVLAAATGAPWGPVVELAQGVWERWPDRAHAILRNRVFVDAERAVDVASAPVVAKKRCVVRAVGTAQVADLGGAAAAARARLEPVTLRARGVDALAWEAARTASVPDSRGVRALSDRPVVAALVARDGTPLLAARNQAGRNRCLHAEVALVQLWWTAHGPIPPDVHVATSLQPCRMCAAVLLAAAASPGRLQVVYAVADPGRLARQTSLARRGQERLAHPWVE